MYNPIKLQKIAFNIYNYNFTLLIQYNRNRIGGVIVSVLFSSAVDRGFEPRTRLSLIDRVTKHKN
jgi:hypothetical protein